jgi:hypothetical protein
MDKNKVITTSIKAGFTIVVNDDYNFGESLTEGLYESHNSYGKDHKYYDTVERCSYACLKMIKENDYSFGLLT